MHHAAQRSNTPLLIDEIIEEAESNDGVKHVIRKRDGSLVVKYRNGFWNQWLASYRGGDWSPTAVKLAVLDHQCARRPQESVAAPTRTRRNS